MPAVNCLSRSPLTPSRCKRSSSHFLNHRHIIVAHFVSVVHLISAASAGLMRRQTTYVASMYDTAYPGPGDSTIRGAQARRCAQAQRAKQRAKWPTVAATEYMVQSPYPVQRTAVKVVTVDQLQDALKKDVLHIVVAAHLDLTPLAASWRTLWSPVGTQTVRVCAHLLSGQVY
jgi:hypothetical protein